MFYAHMLGSITGFSVYVTEVLYFGYSQQSVMSKIWVRFWIREKQVRQKLVTFCEMQSGLLAHLYPSGPVGCT